MSAEHMEAVRQRVLATGADICAVLVEDLAGYPDRELQRRFLAAPDVAESIDDAALKALRAAAAELGRSAAARVATALAQPEPWLACTVAGSAPVEIGKDLRKVSAVWAHVSPVDAALTALAEPHDLGEDEREPAGYAPPLRFIGRRYLPSLVESYLRAASELQALTERSAEEQVATRKRSLAERWAAAGE